MTQAIAIVQKNRHTSQVLLAIASIFVAIYIFSVISIVRETSIRAHAEGEISKLASSVGDLEFTYISMRNDLKEINLADSGLVLISNLAYISRTGNATALAITSIKAQ